MRILVYDSLADWTREAADQVQAVLKSKERPVLMLPTGSTPIAVYEELVRRYRAGEISFSHAVSMNLDEYVGLAHDDPESYHYFMQHYLFDHVDMRPDRIFLPETQVEPAQACRDYDAIYDQYGPADIVLLGLGHNGHIGFNEPGTPFANRTCVVTLSQSTLEANKANFGARDDMPTHALAVGPAMIMESRRALLMVRGAGKASILKKVLTHPITEEIPGTLLQRHPDLVVLADREAAAELELA
ncbi:MAG: glucosamine-6-phosphate deaminase [Eubacteriales bacterium]|nr:glucosamine-6-phosphate deaminase [Eubacteriales bacterium]